MVGIVVVSHSQCLAEGAVELAKLMAGNARIAAAGGLEDGTPGTSFEKIMTAIESVYSEDGVCSQDSGELGRLIPSPLYNHWQG